MKKAQDINTKLIHKKIAICWDIAPCSPYINRRFGGTYRLQLQGKKLAEKENNVRAGG
jgi:hypothetical protein